MRHIATDVGAKLLKTEVLCVESFPFCLFFICTRQMWKIHPSLLSNHFLCLKT